MLCAYFL